MENVELNKKDSIEFVGILQDEISTGTKRKSSKDL